MPLLTRKMILLDDRVKLMSGKVGTVVFKGTVAFAKGIWYGIELDTPDGRHDGTVKHSRYFQTKKNHGAFAQRRNIEGVLTGADAKKKVKQNEDVKETTSKKEKNSTSDVRKNSRRKARGLKNVKIEKRIKSWEKWQKKPKRSRHSGVILLQYVHDVKSRQVPLKLVEKHFEKQKESGNRSRIKKCRIIDLRE